MYLVSSALKTDAFELRRASPDVWRAVRRYNLPVQLALAAAWEAAEASSDPSAVPVFSLAPCRTGSPELYRCVDVIAAGLARGDLGDTRMNPAHTLHTVDNLAMSAFSIRYSNHAYCLGLGGAAGQAWAALEAVGERLASGKDSEALLMAGDQDTAEGGTSGVGIALLFSASPKPNALRRNFVRFAGIERVRKPHANACVPHAAAGLSRLVSAVSQHPGGPLLYEVPATDSDGVDAVKVSIEVGLCARTAAW